MSFSKFDTTLLPTGVTLSNGNKTAANAGTSAAPYEFACVDSSVFADGLSIGSAEPGFCVEWTIDNKGAQQLQICLGPVIGPIGATLYALPSWIYYSNGTIQWSGGTTSTDPYSGSAIPTYANGDKIGLVLFTQYGEHGGKSSRLYVAAFKNGTLVFVGATANPTDYSAYGYPDEIWRSYPLFYSSEVQQVSVECDPALMTYGTALTSFLQVSNYNSTPNLGWSQQPVTIANTTAKNFSLTAGSPAMYKFIVPAGQYSLDFQFIGTSSGGLFDYYIKRGSAPTTTSYDTHGTVTGAATVNEPTIINPTADTYYILLNPTNNSAGSLKGSYVPPPKVIRLHLQTNGVNVANKLVDWFAWYSGNIQYAALANGSVTTAADGTATIILPQGASTGSYVGCLCTDLYRISSGVPKMWFGEKQIILGP